MAWFGVTVASEESHDASWLRLTVTNPLVCRLTIFSDVSVASDAAPRVRAAAGLRVGEPTGA